jgi:tetratricopeptide (TPR) repeat protein
MATAPPSARAQTTGVGDVSFPNSGAPAAQESFLAGLAQLHNFEYDASAELFRKAQQIDPGFALAYWGEAMTYNHPVWMQHDRDAARAVLARLAPSPEGRLAKAKTDREKDYLRAMEILYGDGDKNARDVAYADAMAAMHRTYPDDPDAAAFYALSLLGTAHDGRDFATYMKSAAVLEPIFRDHPTHPGAAHYLIHSYDDPVHAPLGLRAARAYSKIAPSAAHAQHMTSHIFVAMGMWDDVVAANEAAMRVVDQGRAKRNLPPGACGHYNFWLEYGYLQQGRFGAAKKLVADCHAAATRAAARRDAAAAHEHYPDNSLIGSFTGMRARYLIDTLEWTGDVAGWSIAAGNQRAVQITAEFVNGLSALQRGQTEPAREALERLQIARTAMNAELDKAGARDDSYRAGAKILEQLLAGSVQAARGATADGIAALREAAAAEEKLPFEFGPPFIDKPSYELLGEVLLAAGRPEEARTTFEKALARTPERTAALMGLLRAAETLGDRKKAAELKTRLRAIWRAADRAPDLGL